MKNSLYSKEHKLLIKRLVQARKKAGLSQVEVAKKLQTTQPNISMIEAGQRRIEVLELMEFARLYRHGIKHFLKGLS